VSTSRGGDALADRGDLASARGDVVARGDLAGAGDAVAVRGDRRGGGGDGVATRGDRGGDGGDGVAVRGDRRGDGAPERVPEYTKARIARTCRELLERAGAAGVLPTPLEAVGAAAGIRERVPIARVGSAGAISEELRARLLGALWFEERALFLDESQSPARRRFTEAHEIVHALCPWHAGALRLDTASELFAPLTRGIEAEANYGASRLIFQGEAFARAAAGEEPSLRTAFGLAAAFGASRHAAAHEYAETHRRPLALLVAGRWVTREGRLPVWRGVESPSFAARYGPAATPSLDAGDTPLAEALEQARQTSEPVDCEVAAAGGETLSAEVVNNRHCHLVLLRGRA
jgi:hypothetical protein